MFSRHEESYMMYAIICLFIHMIRIKTMQTRMKIGVHFRQFLHPYYVSHLSRSGHVELHCSWAC